MPEAEQETLVSTTFDDAALFQDAVADETPEQPETKPETDGQPRNPDGTFATKAAEAPKAEQPEVKPEPTVEEPDDKAGQIPSWRLREVSQERQEALRQLEAEKAERSKLVGQFAEIQRQLAQFQKPEPKAEEEPDPLLDPKGFKTFIETKFKTELTNTVRNMQMERAHEKHGEVFEKAYQEAQQAMGRGDAQLSVRMHNSANAGEELVKWYRERQTMQEVGTDPNAWLEKKLEERMKDPTFLAKAVEAARNAANGNPVQPGTAPVVKLPPSLSGAARADAHSSAEDNDISDAGLFNYATR